MGDVARNLASVGKRIHLAASGGRPVRLVAVSKTKAAPILQEAYDAGQRVFGENYVQELVEKAPVLPPDIRWHFIGHLQSNKAKVVTQIPNLYMIESIDSVKLANAVNKHVAKVDREEKLRVMVQVNTSGETSKSGVEPGQAVTDLCLHVATQCLNLQLVGLMTIGRLGDISPECFETLAQCRDQVIAANISGVPPADEFELSMGMSGDFELAIQAGSTNVRIGSTIFGARDYSKKNSIAAASPPPPTSNNNNKDTDSLLERLLRLDISRLTPVQAKQELAELKALAEKS